ncbi:dihydrodipicolinate synthase family protein [Devosia nitrariae]|uniref:Dihydrodipicolinate synthase family protein n=1 Tax=Devosia nitrariae TaxID=2071872 RepID=A0ABQ5W734_9HYPH|nr:dihydrodipicolinate synthase family protein [Devosia nitrariae]GLQ55420.1 dihydrodipicolinate synthase family protein [Devosia nitrariae]
MSEAITKVRRALTGISGVPVTPYGGSGALDGAALKALIGRLSRSGVHNLMAAGNTGEFFALALEEIGEVHRLTIEAAHEGTSIVSAAVGRSLADAKRLARDAIAAGADAIMGHHPMDPFAAPAAQARYFLALADSSTVPVIAYVRSDTFSIADFKLLAAHENVAGIKFASNNLMLLGEAIRATAEYPTVWVCGLAEGWAPPFYAMGARGFTSGLVNVFPELSLAIHKALEANDYARARSLIAPIAGFEALRTKYSNGANVTVVKEALEIMGESAGPVRMPGLEALNEEERATLREIVSRVRSINPSA